jgi:hypothetical protein
MIADLLARRGRHRRWRISVVARDEQRDAGERPFHRREHTY